MSEPTVTQFDTPTGKVALRIAGEGRPLVFMHGLGGSSKSWREQHASFAGSRRVIAWDTPGYGDSAVYPDDEPTCHNYAKALLAALDAADVEAFDLVGHSMGGAIAPWVARLAPQRVGKLVLSATKVIFGREQTMGFEKGLAERRQMDDRTFGASRARGMVGEKSPVFAEIAAIAGEVRSPGFERAVALLKQADNRAILPTIDQPTLAIAAENDTVAPVEDVRAVARAVPAARLEIVPDAAHAAYMEQPERYNALLRAFLDD